MRRSLWALALLFLVACDGSGGGLPVPGVEQCAWRYDSRGRPDDAAKIRAALQTAGFQGATATVTDLGESCGNRFARQYSEFRATVPVADLADSANVDRQADRALGVIRPYATGANDKILITLEAGGQRVVREFRGGTP